MTPFPLVPTAKSVLSVIRPVGCALILASAMAGLPGASAARADAARQGADALRCRPEPGSPFAGLQAFDYVVTYRSSTNNADIVAARDWPASLARIGKLLALKVPEYAASFSDFAATVLQADGKGRRVWEEASFGLRDIDDDALVALAPAHCRDGDRMAVTQVVIRDASPRSGLRAGSILYRYDAKAFATLAKASPIQTSFLLVNLWLWDVSGNPDRNRRVARYLHSEAFAQASATDARATLTNMGLTLLEGGLANFPLGHGAYRAPYDEMDDMDPRFTKVWVHPETEGGKMTRFLLFRLDPLHQCFLYDPETTFACQANVCRAVTPGDEGLGEIRITGHATFTWFEPGGVERAYKAFHGIGTPFCGERRAK